MLMTSPEVAQALHVVVDPGHGGNDSGAVRSRLKESDIVLDVALRLKALVASRPDLRVSLTRETDRALSLPERVRIADAQGADLFISLHANAAPDPKARGLEVFFQNSLPPDEESLYLANLENQSLDTEDDPAEIAVDESKKGDVLAIVEDLKRQARLRQSLRFSQIFSETWKGTEPHHGRAPPIKQAPLHVLTRSKRPSVLLELGFLTHPQESKRLSTSEHRDLLAKKIKEALVAYAESSRQGASLPTSISVK